MEIKFLVTVTCLDDSVQEDNSWRNTRNKTVIMSLVRTRYSTIKRRIALNKSYRKLPLCSREEFIEWGCNSEDLARIFKEWNDSGHQNRLMPTVDRVDPKKGYVIGNMKWVAFHDNARRTRGR